MFGFIELNKINKMSDDKEEEFSTPYRGTEDKDISETAVKQGEESNIHEDDG